MFRIKPNISVLLNMLIAISFGLMLLLTLYTYSNYYKALNKYVDSSIRS